MEIFAIVVFLAVILLASVGHKAQQEQRAAYHAAQRAAIVERRAAIRQQRNARQCVRQYNALMSEAEALRKRAKAYKGKERRLLVEASNCLYRQAEEIAKQYPIEVLLG